MDTSIKMIHDFPIMLFFCPNTTQKKYLKQSEKNL